RLAIAAAAEGVLVEPAVVLAIDGNEVEAPDVALIAVPAADADKADALEVVQAHAELEAGSDAAIVGVPVADQDAIDGQERALARGLEEGDVELVQLDGDRLGDAGLLG